MAATKTLLVFSKHPTEALETEAGTFSLHVYSSSVQKIFQNQWGFQTLLETLFPSTGRYFPRFTAGSSFGFCCSKAWAHLWPNTKPSHSKTSASAFYNTKWPSHARKQEQIRTFLFSYNKNWTSGGLRWVPSNIRSAGSYWSPYSLIVKPTSVFKSSQITLHYKMLCNLRVSSTGRKTGDELTAVNNFSNHCHPFCWQNLRNTDSDFN